jgi:hypothetical protein
VFCAEVALSFAAPGAAAELGFLGVEVIWAPAPLICSGLAVWGLGVDCASGAPGVGGEFGFVVFGTVCGAVFGTVFGTPAEVEF